MRFWDASAIVPLLVAEPSTRRLQALAAKDPAMLALRSGDALQLAAAFMASERRPTSLEMVTLDDRLASAAQKEGFAVLQVATSSGR